MAAMNVQVIISAMDRFTPTLDRLEKRLRGLDRYGGRFGPGGGTDFFPGVGPGGAPRSTPRPSDSGSNHVGWRYPQPVDGPALDGNRRGGGAFTSLGVSPGLLGAGAAGLGMKEVISQAADFETALTEIQKKGGFSADQTAKLGEEIKSLATDGNLAVPISEIAAAYERGAAAGIPLDDLRNFAALSVKAADGFGMSAEEVGNFSAKLSKGLGLSEEEITHTFDLINSLADAGIADESQVVDFIDRAGASLKTLGLSTEQTAALGTTLLNIGMRSETASTGMGALASQMLTVGQLSGKGKRSFEKYMGPVGDFAQLVDQDANAALLTMLDTLDTLSKADRMEFLTNFSGREWSDEMLRLVEASDEYRRNLAMAGDQASWMGSLDAAYELKLDDFWSQWQIAKNALAELTIDVGTAGMPVFQAALGLAKRTIDEIDAGLEQFALSIDTSELEAAKLAVADLITSIREMMSMGGSDASPIMNFFTRLSEMANTVSRTVNISKDVLQALGLVDPDADTPEVREQRRSDFFQGIENIDGGMVGAEINNAYKTAHRVATQTPEENATRNAAGVADWRSDYDASGAAYAPSSDPAFEARVRAREAARAAAAAEEIVLDEIVVRSAPTPPPTIATPAYIPSPPPEVNLQPPPIESVPIPIQRPELDTAAYLLSADQLVAARAGIEAPIQSTADVNITPAMAKLATLRAEAAATAQAVSASLAGGGGGGGDASRFESRVNDQF